MIERRDMLIALACASALGAAEGLRPRHKLARLREGAKLTDIVPAHFAGWAVGGGGDIVLPRTEGSLAARLYSDQLARVYKPDAPAPGAANGSIDPEVMVLIAYGAAQNDVLQLHRPEVCYPAIGFQITARQMLDLPLPSGAVIPAVALTAQSGGRIEDIVYWTRVGDALPRTAGEQRSDRLRSAIAGYVGDGMLVRASSVRIGSQPNYPTLEAFMVALMKAVAPRDRAAFIGSAINV